ncbi:Transcriptional regulator, RpiR family [Burkholderiales bacterium 8X]|nr:Transcriptional regulator, RpiR family [Burkholderiales bacterium 8X]
MTAASGDPPYTLEALKQSIAGRFESLPARLQVAARYLVDHPNASAVETIKTLSDAAEVQPSVLVRLAKSFGYSGFSEMQAVFRTALLAQTQSYGERMRAQRAGRRAASPQTPEAMLHQLCEGSIESLQGLRDAIDPAMLKRAIDLLASARTINVLGLRRSWPIATYFAYLLSRSQRFVRLLGGMGGMLTDEVRVLGSDDVLVAISFHPFHAEAVAAIQQARAQGTPVLALTDSGLSTIAQQATVALEVHDADIGGFRTVAASMALCHGLTVGLLSEDEARTNANPKSGRARPARRNLAS